MTLNTNRGLIVSPAIDPAVECALPMKELTLVSGETSVASMATSPPASAPVAAVLSPGPQVTPAPPSSGAKKGASSTGKPTKSHVPSACINCKKAHLACDISRPCKRCVTMGKTASCADVKHKKRGRPKLKDRKTLPEMRTAGASHMAPSPIQASTGSPVASDLAHQQPYSTASGYPIAYAYPGHPPTSIPVSPHHPGTPTHPVYPDQRSSDGRMALAPLAAATYSTAWSSSTLSRAAIAIAINPSPQPYGPLTVGTRSGAGELSLHPISPMRPPPYFSPPLRQALTSHSAGSTVGAHYSPHAPFKLPPLSLPERSRGGSLAAPATTPSDAGYHPANPPVAHHPALATTDHIPERFNPKEEVVVILSMDGLCVRVTENCSTVLGLPASRLLNQQLTDFLYANDAPRFLQLRQTLLDQLVLSAPATQPGILSATEISSAPGYANVLSTNPRGPNSAHSPAHSTWQAPRASERPYASSTAPFNRPTGSNDRSSEGYFSANVAKEGSGATQSTLAQVDNTFLRTSEFYRLPITSLMVIAKHSSSTQDRMHFRRSDDGSYSLFNVRLHLGGGLGAECNRSDTYHHLYLTCYVSPFEFDSLLELRQAGPYDPLKSLAGVPLTQSLVHLVHSTSVADKASSSHQRLPCLMSPGRAKRPYADTTEAPVTLDSTGQQLHRRKFSHLSLDSPELPSLPLPPLPLSSSGSAMSVRALLSESPTSFTSTPQTEYPALDYLQAKDDDDNSD
ncbi:hypothetical protein H4R35_006295 [Dimargaris xerosporica]|nr:hypothetical protein H4R35_006295 [Dimargaris xerosporica]